ncbi:hypothetical protein HPP92_003069 [Vanilla planifolia]|uniref:Cytochrome c oxidase assembly factor 5 n=1 Tax=Vanilla planifolia TaxID=51239 RepID=A0A835SFS0_VANPL|nr:hypothetical protein HPP92_003069 [Vanilla planifolia]
MSKSCKGLAMELVKCLSETDCVKVQNRPYRECAGEKEPSISSECIGLRETYFNCKRGQVALVKKMPMLLTTGDLPSLLLTLIIMDTHCLLMILPWKPKNLPQG